MYWIGLALLVCVGIAIMYLSGDMPDHPNDD
jgi:hypothetical protein